MFWSVLDVHVWKLKSKHSAGKNDKYIQDLHKHVLHFIVAPVLLWK